MSDQGPSFHLRRAIGGHANDGDSLELLLPAASPEAAAEVCAALGVPLERARPNEPQPVPGRPYPGAEMARFRSLTPGEPRHVQPGHVHLGGEPCFVWVSRAGVTIIVVGGEGDPYRVTAVDEARAARIEGWLRRRGL